MFGFVPESKREPRKAAEQGRGIRNLSTCIRGLYLIHSSLGTVHLNQKHIPLGTRSFVFQGPSKQVGGSDPTPEGMVL